MAPSRVKFDGAPHARAKVMSSIVRDPNPVYRVRNSQLIAALSTAKSSEASVMTLFVPTRGT